MKTIQLPARLVSITTAPGEAYTVTVEGKTTAGLTYRQACRIARKAGQG